MKIYYTNCMEIGQSYETQSTGALNYRKQTTGKVQARS